LHQAIDAGEVRLLSLASGFVEASAFLDVGNQLVVDQMTKAEFMSSV